ncbi:hypothetical protein D3C72_2565190 [compost metagenome]
MDFEEVDVLKGQSLAGQQARDCENRRHEEAVLTVNEVDGGRLAIQDGCELGQAV